MAKVLSVRWFCAGHGNVGIVRCFDDYEGIQYFIGQCSGLNEELDKRHIAELGSRFPYEAGSILFGDKE